MNRIKNGRDGRVTLPRGDRKGLLLKEGDTLLVEVTADGAVRLQPATSVRTEAYSSARVREFEAATQVDKPTRDAVARGVSAASR
ncbi:MAG: AbrB/MazE/SpoVT family DNA-binding domain-containing protein, partial [Lysobacterales bacterium]